jgi:uncharacterized protein (TIGR02145 family)
MKIFITLAFTMLMITLPALCDAQKNNSSIVGDGVVINGVKWATCNVDKPGTFATAPDKPGMFYQWNNNLGWSATNPLINSKGSREWSYNLNCATNEGSEITKWAINNDPSPKGWRLPTVEEFRTLLDKEKVDREWITQNGVTGYKFMDKTTGQFIFFPAAGYRDDQSIEGEEDIEKLYDVDLKGFYWSKSTNEKDWVYCFSFFKQGAGTIVDGISKYEMAFSIRSVATQQTQSATIKSILNQGRFPQATERLLKVSDLQSLSKEDLKIMRNEIFARHGYIFTTEAMNAYFRKQSWYSPRYSNVNSMLTNIEMKNIELIKRYE